MRRQGNIGELLTTGICVLAMTFVMLQYMDLIGLLYRKWEVIQLARTSILQMETVGYLEPESQKLLTGRLEMLGVEAVSLEGSTLHPVGYGAPIVLRITGELDGYELEEIRTSTAKH